MRKLREVLKLYLHHKLTGRAIARSVSISPSTATGYLARIRVAGLSWPLPTDLDSDEALTRLLFPEQTGVVKGKREPDWAALHVTKQLLWEEYKSANNEGYQYSAFCRHYALWAAKLQLSMRQEHRVGEKLFIDFIDFSGDGVVVVDPKTGEVKQAVLFVAVLGASSYTYVEPVLREDLPATERAPKTSATRTPTSRVPLGVRSPLVGTHTRRAAGGVCRTVCSRSPLVARSPTRPEKATAVHRRSVDCRPTGSAATRHPACFATACAAAWAAASSR
jgi:hypothetical protein